jgi:protein TonB
MSTTAEAGTYAAPSGNTLHGVPPAAGEPGEAKPYRSEGPATAAEVSTLPEPVQVELPRSEYPPNALRAGIEGAVKLRLVIDAEGNVREARVVSDPGYGLGPAAARAAKRWFRFRPARKDGAPVAVEIPFTVRFVLE